MDQDNPVTSDFDYDPVNVVNEATASGMVADLFSDIRQTMNIPIVTSIWRALAVDPDTLASAWHQTKIIFESHLPDSYLGELKKLSVCGSEALQNRFDSTLATRQNIPQIHAVIDSYNRSNTLNLIALSALISSKQFTGKIQTKPKDAPGIPKLIPLREKKDIPTDVWHLVEEVNRLGTNEDKPAVATLWRHLSAWPKFLEDVSKHFSTPQQSDLLMKKNLEIIEASKSIGDTIRPHVDCDTNLIPKNALDLVKKYVTSPIQVVRMVVIGNTLEYLVKNSSSHHRVSTQIK
jgi:hypothetical protein